MKFEFEGRTREIDMDELGLRQGIAIQEHMGMPLTEWEKALTTPRDMGWLKAMRCLYWLMLAQAGDLTPLDADIDFPVLKFSGAVSGALSAEADTAAAVEEDPTKPAGAPAAAPPATPATGSPGSPAVT